MKSKKKKKKKKKGPSSALCILLFLLPIFHLPFYNFPSFLLNFHPFPPLSPFFSIRQQKFPSQKSLRGTLPPACYATAYVVLSKSYAKNFRAQLQSVNFIIFQSLHSSNVFCIICFHLNFLANLTSKNVRGNHIVSSLVCSLASEFTNQKFSKTSTFSCSYLIFHSVILLTPPPFQYIFFQTLVYCLLQKYLWEHVPTLFTFFCCHVVQNIRVLWVPMCLHMSAQKV